MPTEPTALVDDDSPRAQNARLLARIDGLIGEVGTLNQLNATLAEQVIRLLARIDLIAAIAV